MSVCTTYAHTRHTLKTCIVMPTYTHTHTNTHTHTYCTHTYIHAYIYTIIHTCIQSDTHTYICAPMHTYSHKHIHTYLNTYTYSHPSTQTYTMCTQGNAIINFLFLQCRHPSLHCKYRLGVLFKHCLNVCTEICVYAPDIRMH